MHRGEVLIIDQNMVSSAMLFLIQSKVDNIAAFGLLRLIFQNDISLFNFPVQLLYDFQSTYEQTIQNFYKSIPKLRFQLNELLPATCFCFTAPLIKSLKEGGDILHRQVPYQFMPYLIEIICYSFTNDEIVFEKFLNTFKLGCMKLYDNLLQIDFENLLQEITDRTKSMEPHFFKSLIHANGVLERGFELLKERKIEKFDLITINSLIDSSSEKFQIMKQRPKIIKEGSKRQIDQIVQQLIHKNQQVELSFLNEECILNLNDKELFSSMGIVNLLPVQKICFKFCSQLNQQKPIFIQYDTGQGKTSLCIGIAIKKALTGQKVYILNNSKTLLFRDFKKAQELQEKFHIQIMYVNEENVFDQEHSDINYLELEAFQKYFDNNDFQTRGSPLFIIDEYDSILFSDYENVSKFIKIISTFINVIAFSGTKLEQYHKTFINQNIDSTIIDFSLDQSIKVHQVCHEQQIYYNLDEYRKKIVTLCRQLTEKTPVILILQKQQLKIKNSIEKLKIPVQTLYDKDSLGVDSSLQIFNEKQGLLYGVFIINEEQGRGLDFISNSEIEQNGGIYLIIGCLPNYYLQYQQFIGRTKKIGNKGQYSVILYDKDAKNNDAKDYLNQTLIKLQNKEILQIATIKRLNIKNINNNDKNPLIIEEENKQNIEDNLILESEYQNEQINEKFIIEEDESMRILKNEKQLEDFQSSSDNENFFIQQKENQQCQDLIKKRVQKFNAKDNSRLSRRLQIKNSLKGEIDRLYFENYLYPQIHEEMLNDQIRMNAFEQAIKQIVQGLIVIDVGAGTGVLSMFAAKYGAKRIFAIEYCEMAKQAQQAVHDNGLTSQITVVKEQAEFVELPIGKVDVIVSEWMGYFLLKENMLPSVLHIRNKYLKENGKIIPKRSSLYLAAISKQQKIHGLNLASIGQDFKNLVRIDICKEELIISTSQEIFNIDIENDSMENNSFGSDFELEVIKEGTINGFVGWFDADLTDEVKLSTSPFEKETHWKHTLFFFNDEKIVKMKEKINGKIKVYPNNENYRSIDIYIYLTKPLP